MITNSTRNFQEIDALDEPQHMDHSPAHAQNDVSPGRETTSPGPSKPNAYR